MRVTPSCCTARRVTCRSATRLSLTLAPPLFLPRKTHHRNSGFNPSCCTIYLLLQHKLTRRPWRSPWQRHASWAWSRTGRERCWSACSGSTPSRRGRGTNWLIYRGKLWQRRRDWLRPWDKWQEEKSVYACFCGAETSNAGGILALTLGFKTRLISVECGICSDPFYSCCCDLWRVIAVFILQWDEVMSSRAQLREQQLPWSAAETGITPHTHYSRDGRYLVKQSLHFKHYQKVAVLHQVACQSLQCRNALDKKKYKKNNRCLRNLLNN